MNIKVGWSNQTIEICCWKKCSWCWRCGNLANSFKDSAERIVVGWCYASWQALMENEVLTSLSLEGNRVHSSVCTGQSVECVFLHGWYTLTCCMRLQEQQDLYSYANGLFNSQRIHENAIPGPPKTSQRLGEFVVYCVLIQNDWY